MTEYEQGFEDGERCAYRDRADRINSGIPAGRSPAYMRGWRDGYTPSSVTWAIRSPDSARPWWMEREAA